VCAGFWAVLLVPSPKVHDHAVGLPVEVSVNWTGWFVAGDEGVTVNEATGVDTVWVLEVTDEVTVWVADEPPQPTRHNDISWNTKTK